MQKLLLQKTSQKEGEDALLFDAAQVVAQRRRSSRGRGGGGDGKGRVQKDAAEPQAEDEEGNDATANSANREATLKTFEHTGWFHTYE